MIDLDTLSIVLTGIGLIIALVYYSMTLRHTSKARQKDLVFQRYQDYGQGFGKALAEVSALEWETVEDWHRKYSVLADPDAWSSYLYISRLYNMAGVLLMENVAEADLIYKLYDPATLISFWERHEPIVLYRRERVNDPSFYEPFEFLYKEAKRRFPDVRSVRAIDPNEL